MSKIKELYLNNISDLVLREAKSLPPAKSDEVKLKIIYGGICGSDLKVYKGLISYAEYPLRPDHEVVGEIIEAGPDVLNSLMWLSKQPVCQHPNDVAMINNPVPTAVHWSIMDIYSPGKKVHHVSTN